MDESTPNDTTTRSARRRWAVPAVVAGVVVAAVATPPLVAAAGDADLPEVTPEELVTSVLEADDVALQGTVVHTARLGLPELPITEIDGADPLALLGGSSTVRVWSDGDDRSRLALLGRTSEFSVVRDGAEAWTYSSSDDEVVHYTLDEAGQARYAAPDVPEVPGDLPSPQDGADLLLGELREHSNVSVDAPTTVAGRAAYQLVVTPQDEGTLVDRAVLAVDAETRLPLRYQVWSTTAPDAPAIEVGFTDVTFRAPDPDVLDFSAPAGASVREVVVPTGHEKAAEQGHERRAGDDVAEVPDGVGGAVHGEGWSRVVEVSGVDVAALVAEDPSAAVDPEAFGRLGSDRAQELADEMGFEERAEGFDLDTAALYEQLTTEVPEGRLLSSTLLSVLVTDDGRVLAGAVPPETLRDRV